MKRSVLWSVIALAFFFGVVCSKLPINGVPHIGVVLYAQSVPATVTASWNPNPATENVTSYILTLDTGSSVTVSAASCSATACSSPLSVAAFGNHTYTVAAVNTNLSGGAGVTGSPQTGASTSLAFTLNPRPSAPAGASAK
jgi:hypothetical protein